MATTNWYKEAKDAYKKRAEAQAQKLGISLPANFTDLAGYLGGKSNYSGNLGTYGDADYHFYKTAVGNANYTKGTSYDWVKKNFSPESAVQLYKNNAKDFYQKVLNQAGWDYAQAYFNKARFPKTPGYTEALDKKQKALQELIVPATLNGVNSQEFQTLANKGANQWTNTFKADVAASKDTGFWGAFGAVMQIATPIAFAVMTSGLSLPQQLLVNSMYSLSNGAKPEDVVRGIVGSIAANEVAGVLKGINQQIASAGPKFFQDDVVSALVNAERQAVYALATGQDVGTAALAGAAGGGAASLSSLLTDNKLLQQAAGEFVQKLSSGSTLPVALTDALSGYLVESAQEKQKAEEAIKKQVASDIENIEWSKLSDSQREFLKNTYAQLVGSNIDGKTVMEAGFSAAPSEDWPKIFPEADFRYDPAGKVGNVFQVTNNQGEAILAREITNPDGVKFYFYYNNATGETGVSQYVLGSGRTLDEQFSINVDAETPETKLLKLINSGANLSTGNASVGGGSNVTSNIADVIINSGNVVSDVSNVATGNVTTGNVSTDNVSTGNVSIDGGNTTSDVINLISSGGNVTSNVGNVTIDSGNVASNISDVGNVTLTGGNVVSNVGNVTLDAGNVVSNVGNVTVQAGNTTSDLINLIATGGNVTIDAGNVASNVANVTSNVSDVISDTGNVTTDAGNVVITGGNVAANVTNTTSDLINLINSGANVTSDVGNVTLTGGNVTSNVVDEISNVGNVTIADANVSSNLANVVIDSGNVASNLSNVVVTGGNTTADLINLINSGGNVTLDSGNVASNVIIDSGNVATNVSNVVVDAGNVVSNVSNVVVSGGDTNVANVANVTTGNVIIDSGNTTADLINLINSGSNVSTGNVTTDNVITDNVTSNVVVSGGETNISNVSTGNVSTGNVLISGGETNNANASVENVSSNVSTSGNDTILLSLLNQPINREILPMRTPSQTNASPGSAALAQALRIGDAGVPIFGGDKEKSKRSGWNVESLRYMGNSEDK